jgi:hypothetical protein
MGIGKSNKLEVKKIITNLHAKYPPVREKNIKTAYAQLPDTLREGIKFERWKDIYKGKKPDEIFTAFLKTCKERKKREYSTDDSYYAKSKNYKGRKPDKEWDIIREALEILIGRTLKEWQEELNITPSQYYELQEQILTAKYDKKYGLIVEESG